MKKIFLSMLAVCLFAAASFAQAASLPTIKFGSLTKSGKMAATDFSSVGQLTLDLNGNPASSIVGFEMQVILPDGKLISRAPVDGSMIPEEMQVVLKRQHTGTQVVIKDVRVKDEMTGQTKYINGLTIEVL